MDYKQKQAEQRKHTMIYLAFLATVIVVNFMCLYLMNVLKGILK
jgi:hypothetical protein